MKKFKIMKVKAIANRENVQLLTIHIVELVVKSIICAWILVYPLNGPFL